MGSSDTTLILQGVALDFDLTRTPAPVYLDAKKNQSRNYRANARDHSNMLLRESRPNNVLDEERWKGHGFPGYLLNCVRNEITIQLARDRLLKDCLLILSVPDP